MPTLVAGHTFARVVCNQIDACRIVLAFGRQAFVNVQRAIVGFVTGRTRAGVVFRWVRTGTAIFTVLKDFFFRKLQTVWHRPVCIHTYRLEAQNASFLGFR